jgi:CheY-like chemotaxis protein
VRFDAGQAEQILVNLAANARDAMPHGGQLTLETSNVTIDDAYVSKHPDSTVGDYVLLAVSDTGMGMSAETREHAFEPFFTTKAVGRGTGLGLAMIHGAVMQNGGRVEVYSEPGHGTSFKIYLPVVRDATEPLAAPSVDAPPGGTESVLLVEDDPTVRTLAVRLLTRLGYRVTDFAGGADALQWLRETEQPVHLLLTDVIMPEMNGKQLAEQVLAIRPGIRVLFVSGYTANVIVHHGVLKPGVDFLPKPFSISSLAKGVRAVLDGVRV